MENVHRVVAVGLLIVSSFLLDGCKKSLPSDFPTQAANVSLLLISNLSGGKYAEAHELLNDQMQAGTTIEQLERDWKSLLTRMGDFQEVSEFKTETVSGVTIIVLTGSFQGGKSTISVNVDANGAIDAIDYGP